MTAQRPDNPDPADPSRRPLPNSGRVAAALADPAPLFVYGTLRFAEVVQVLIDRSPDRRGAQLDRWQVTALPDHPYPSLIPAAGATAVGELLDDLTVAERLTLDAFEAPGYLLPKVMTSSGPAYVYAAAPGHRLTPVPWSLEQFRREQLPNYLDRCRSWRQYYDSQL